MSTSSSYPAPDLLKCSADELATYLLEHRFENDGMETTEFLLEATTKLPNAEVIAAQLMQDNANNNNDQQSTTKKSPAKEIVALVSSCNSEESKAAAIATNKTKLGQALHSSPVEVSLANPRGKFSMTFHKNGVQATTIKNPQQLIIPAGTVRNIIVFPKPTDCQRIKSTSKNSNNNTSNSPMILICFECTDDDNADDNSEKYNCNIPVTFKDKPLEQICFALPTTVDRVLDEAFSNADITGNATEAWIQLLCHSLSIPLKSVYRIANPAIQDAATSDKQSSWRFKSHQEANTSTTSGLLPFVKCYHGVQDGCLYPMEQGLLFFKPPLFVPRNQLHSISCGRGAGASSRYVDMVITTNDDTNLEFTNISREELGVLNDYIHNVLIPSMQRDQFEATQNSDGGENDDGDDDKTDSNEAVVVAVAASNSTDDENDDEEVVEVTAEGSRCRSKRRAAQEAMQQTKHHFQQQNKSSNQKSDESDDDNDSEDDAYNSGDDENDDDDSEQEEAEDKSEVSGDEVEVIDDDEEEEDDDAVEVVDETDDEHAEVSPPQSKKRRSM